MQSFDSIEIYVYARSKYLVYEKEENKCNNLIKQFNKTTSVLSMQNTNNWRLWIWKKKNLLFNLILHQPDIDKISLYVKDPHKA